MTRPTAVAMDVFSGLFAQGVRERAGYRLLGTLEHSNYGARTFKRNFPRTDQRIGIDNWQPEDFKGVDLMFGNPPCAAWAGMQPKRWDLHDDKLQIIRDLVDVCVTVQPKAWLIESVTRAWTLGRPFLLEQMEVLLGNGYHVTLLLQNNRYLGAPQNRPRLFLIAHRHPLVWPRMNEDAKTVGEVLDSVPNDLPESPVPLKPLPAAHVELWKRSLDFGGYLRKTLSGIDPEDEMGYRPIPHITCRRLRRDQVAPVQLEVSKRLHPDRPRTLTWYEALAFAGLPFDWKPYPRGIEAATYELARAVMPPVGAWVARAVKSGLNKPRLPGYTYTARLVDLRKPEKPHEEIILERGA